MKQLLKQAAGWIRSIACRVTVTCVAVMEIINPNLHVSRSMAEVLAIDDARGRVNKKCVVSSVVILDSHTCIFIIRSISTKIYR